MNNGTTGTYGARRLSRGKAHPGSSRWFRRYRWLVICGWLIMILAVAWLLFFRSDQPPVAPLAALVTERSASVADAAARMPAVKLPADDAAHDKLTEWWYYSGHLQTESGERYSFHMAAFVRRGALTHTVFHGSLPRLIAGRPFDGLSTRTKRTQRTTSSATIQPAITSQR